MLLCAANIRPFPKQQQAYSSLGFSNSLLRLGSHAKILRVGSPLPSCRSSLLTKVTYVDGLSLNWEIYGAIDV